MPVDDWEEFRLPNGQSCRVRIYGSGGHFEIIGSKEVSDFTRAQIEVVRALADIQPFAAEQEVDLGAWAERVLHALQVLPGGGDVAPVVRDAVVELLASGPHEGDTGPAEELLAQYGTVSPRSLLMAA